MAEGAWRDNTLAAHWRRRKRPTSGIGALMEPGLCFLQLTRPGSANAVGTRREAAGLGFAGAQRWSGVWRAVPAGVRPAWSINRPRVRPRCLLPTESALQPFPVEPKTVKRLAQGQAGRLYSNTPQHSPTRLPATAIRPQGAPHTPGASAASSPKCLLEIQLSPRKKS